MNLTGRFIYLLLLAAMLPAMAAGQSPIFEIKLLDSLKSPLPQNKFISLPGGMASLQITLNRQQGDQYDYFISVVEYNEQHKTASVVFPSGDTPLPEYMFERGDTVMTDRFVDFSLPDPDTFSLAVLISRKRSANLEQFFETISREGPERSRSRFYGKKGYLFDAFIKLLNSDINVLPAPAEVERMVQVKSDNLLEIEPDLEFIRFFTEAGVCFARPVIITTKETTNNKNILLHHTIISPPDSTMLLSWTVEAPLVKPVSRTFLDAMIADAAEKHLNLSMSRGVKVNASEYYRFTLKEMVETLGLWKNNKVGLLLYSLDSAGLHILYADNESKKDTVTLPIGQQKLFDLESQLRSRLAAGGSRGLRPVTKNGGPGTDSIVNIISRLLLPAKFNLSTLDHLVIVPTLNIGAFPFAMLKLEERLLLIDKLSYSIVPSINEFIITGRIRQEHYEEPGQSRYDIMGDSVYWSFKRPVLFIGYPETTGLTGYQFDKLPGTKYEITTLSKKVTYPVVLIGKDAVKEKVLLALPGADIIYFATHAVADGRDPLNKSFILLSGKDSTALLTAKEIQETNLRASLVVLSACETGLGKAHEGGMIGLARAFEIAGVKNVLMSLWPVSDSKTPKLMMYFFDEMKNKGNGQVFFPHEAFRRAVLKFRNEFPDPLYWAAFSLFGVPL